MNHVIKHVDCTIIEGHRGRELQDEYFRAHKSYVKWPNGMHNKNPSEAVDAILCPIDWNDREAHYYFGGFVKGAASVLGVSLRWGGDWDGDTDFSDQTFDDLVHFELMDVNS